MENTMMNIDIAALGMVFDVVLVVAMLGLWVMWFQQVGQRKKVEAMLKQASSELEQATVLLNQMMEALPKLQAKPSEHVVEKKAQTISRQDQINITKNVQKLKASLPKNTHSSDNIAAQIMRLNREGLSIQAIAKKLALPVAQVRLMLLLQTSKA